MKQARLSTKMYVSVAIPLAMLILLTSGVFVMSDKVESKANLARTESFVFAAIANQMKVDVIQVQQWLTDISATRGLDGLDDGFDEAASSRESFLKGAAEFDRMYREENAAEDLAQLEALKKAFEGYYEQGRKMAQAYVAEGPAGGNKIMAAFDEAASKMAASLDPFVEQQANELEQAMLDVNSASTSLRVSSLACGALALVLGLTVSAIVIRSVTRPITIAIEGIRQ